MINHKRMKFFCSQRISVFVTSQHVLRYMVVVVLLLNSCNLVVLHDNWYVMSQRERLLVFSLNSCPLVGMLDED